MAMVVQHNMSAMNANRNLGVTTGMQAKSSEKLSSGYKINRAADDAAGLTISEKMRSQIRERILQKAGYTGAERIYISNEYGENKAGGDLFHRVIRDFSGARIVHIGDNPHSDQKMAKASGLDILPYQNVNKNVLLYRPMDMSSMIGGAYRGLVSNHLYNGSEKFSIDYEYGYVYGGCDGCAGSPGGRPGDSPGDRRKRGAQRLRPGQPAGHHSL